MRTIQSFAAGALLTIAAAAQAALPDEIQVYTDDINKPGEAGLELHVNTTPRGVDRSDYPREQTTHHGLRVTPEFSYGVSDNFDVGLYLPMTYKDGNWSAAGYKLRAKWLPVRGNGDEGGWFAGANIELSNISARFNASRHNAELRLMIGHRSPDWLFAMNPTFGWALSPSQQTPAPQNTQYRAGYKVARTLAEGIAVGAEYYNEKGRLGAFDAAGAQSKMLFWVLDFDRKPLPFNVGIGHGLNSNSDRWTVKFIFDVSAVRLNEGAKR